MTIAGTTREVVQNTKQWDKSGWEALEKFLTGRMFEKTVGFCDSHKKNNISYFKDTGPV